MKNKYYHRYIKLFEKLQSEAGLRISNNFNRKQMLYNKIKHQ